MLIKKGQHQEALEQINKGMDLAWAFPHRLLRPRRRRADAGPLQGGLLRLQEGAGAGAQFRDGERTVEGFRRHARPAKTPRLTWTAKAQGPVAAPFSCRGWRADSDGLSAGVGGASTGGRDPGCLRQRRDPPKTRYSCEPIWPDARRPAFPRQRRFGHAMDVPSMLMPMKALPFYA